MSTFSSTGIRAQQLAALARTLDAEGLAKEVAPAFFLSFQTPGFVHPGSTGKVPPSATTDEREEIRTIDIVLRFLPVRRRSESRNNFIGVGRLDGNDLCIPDASVSKFHAYLTGSDTRFFLVDAGSANGTWVERRLIAARGTPVLLKSGDTVRFGAASASFLLAADALQFLRDNFSGA